MIKTSKAKLLLLVLCAAVIGLVMATIVLLNNTPPDIAVLSMKESERTRMKPVQTVPVKKNALAGQLVAGQTAVENTENTDGEEISQEDLAILEIKERFGPTISNKFTQVKALEKIMQFLSSAYPDDWETRVYAFLQKTFPEMADELFEQYQKVMQYRTWLTDNRQDLNLLSRKDRLDRLWDMRYMIFGEDANDIWLFSLKNEQIYDSLEKIATSEDISLQEKTKIYLEGIRLAYESDADRLIENRRQELMDRFLTVESVQKELHSLSPDIRKQKLREFRKSFGLDEEALNRWEKLDSDRDNEWEKGTAYMKKRTKLAAKYTGDELESHLQELRVETFGAEMAEVIKNDEAAGYFCYDGSRIIGRQ